MIHSSRNIYEYEAHILHTVGYSASCIVYLLAIMKKRNIFIVYNNYALVSELKY